DAVPIRGETVRLQIALQRFEKARPVHFVLAIAGDKVGTEFAIADAEDAKRLFGLYLAHELEAGDPDERDEIASIVTLGESSQAPHTADAPQRKILSFRRLDGPCFWRRLHDAHQPVASEHLIDESEV